MLASTRHLALTFPALALASLGGVAFAQSAPIGAQAPSRMAVRVDAPVLVVDQAGSGHYLGIDQALQSAQEDTLILVRSGTYAAPLQIDTQGITLQADEGATVEVQQRLTIRQIDPGRSVVISGLTLMGGLTIEDCAGNIRVDRCTAPEPIQPVGPPPGTSYWEWSNCGIGLSAHTIRNSDAVTLVDSVFHGARGLAFTWDGSPGHHALMVESSTVALYGCFLFGGDGADATSPGHFPVTAGAGGDGLRVLGAGSTVRTCDLSAIGGMGGTFTPGGNGSFGVTLGCDGIPVRTDAGSTAEACPVDDLTFTIAPIARGGTFPMYTIEAPAGTAVFLMIASEQDWRAFGPESGILHLAAPTMVVPLGTMPSGGVLTRPFPARAARYALGHVRTELQVFATIGGVDRYSDPRTLVVVDPSL